MKAIDLLKKYTTSTIIMQIVKGNRVCHGLLVLVMLGAQRVPNKFGGMRDSAFFLLGYLGFEVKTGAGSGKYKYERERDFVLL